DPTHCENCGIKNIDCLVYKNGTEPSRITIPISGITPTYLYLKKQRFFCKACVKSFTATTPTVRTDCYISEHTKAQVVIKSAEAQPILSIARDCSVSTSTVQRLINQEAKTYNPHHKILPDHLSFDEFKYAAGRMAFEYINAVSGVMIYILERRYFFAMINSFLAIYNMT